MSGPADSLTQPQRLEDLLLYRLSMITRSSSLSLVRLFEGGLGITRREWHVLALVAQQHPSPQPPSQIAARSGLDRPRVSRALASLVERGLLQRGAGRAVIATASGQAMYQRALAQAQAFNQALLAPLAPQQREQLHDLLHGLQAQAAQLHEQAAMLPPARRHAGGTRRRSG